MTIDRSKLQFTNEMVPRGYDEYLVPHLFAPWAEALVAALAPKRGGRALDVATGPGTVARVLSTAIGPDGQVAALDASPAMIARAQSKGDVPGGAPIAYSTGPAAPLPYPDAAFDVVTCQQGLQFFPDAREALAEMRRVVVGRGKVSVSVWKPLAECTVFNAFAESLAAAGLDEIAGLLTIPFPLWTGTEIAERARTAGFTVADVEVESRDLVFPAGVSQTLQAFSGTPIGPMLAALDPDRMARLVTEATKRFGLLQDETGAVRGAMHAWVLTARA